MEHRKINIKNVSLPKTFEKKVILSKKILFQTESAISTLFSDYFLWKKNERVNLLFFCPTQWLPAVVPRFSTRITHRYALLKRF